jgi:putative flippase GtrA
MWAARLSLREKYIARARALEREVEKLETRYPVVRTFRFAIAGVLGFGVTEAVLTVSLLLIYGKLGVPHASFSSLGLIGLDVLSLVLGVSTSFVINERITVNVPKAMDNSGKRFRRFLRFQAVSGLGNAGIIVVQLILLAALEISPLLGTIIGAVVTYPIVYSISIKYVWEAHHVR